MRYSFITQAIFASVAAIVSVPVFAAPSCQPTGSATQGMYRYSQNGGCNWYVNTPQSGEESVNASISGAMPADGNIYMQGRSADNTASAFTIHSMAKIKTT